MTKDILYKISHPIDYAPGKQCIPGIVRFKEVANLIRLVEERYTFFKEAYVAFRMRTFHVLQDLLELLDEKDKKELFMKALPAIRKVRPKALNLFFDFLIRIYVDTDNVNEIVNLLKNEHQYVATKAEYFKANIGWNDLLDRVGIKDMIIVEVDWTKTIQISQVDKADVDLHKRQLAESEVTKLALDDDFKADSTEVFYDTTYSWNSYLFISYKVNKMYESFPDNCCYIVVYKDESLLGISSCFMESITKDRILLEIGYIKYEQAWNNKHEAVLPLDKIINL